MLPILQSLFYLTRQNKKFRLYLLALTVVGQMKKNADAMIIGLNALLFTLSKRFFMTKMIMLFYTFALIMMKKPVTGILLFVSGIMNLAKVLKNIAHSKSMAN